MCWGLNYIFKVKDVTLDILASMEIKFKPNLKLNFVPSYFVNIFQLYPKDVFFAYSYF